MRLLLDTHTVLWAIEDSPLLSPRAREVIEEPTNQIVVSAVSAIEIAIKKSIGKLRAPAGFERALVETGFIPLPVDFDSAAALETLPWHHNDPFDRLLVATAMAHGMPIVTRAPQIARYQVQVIW